ncbi:MAG: coproporphyrinogen III oxidase family protein [Candidatus Saccharicenans sp.]|jgi:oxygen-independent coproporphyrinogen-3 oxidase|nr:coproporphyrinogen III oxidase family protein [Candidatus Saccharicenans sp.]
MEKYYKLIRESLETGREKPKTGLYLHYPFCRSKCAYCHFSSVIFEPALHRKWLSAIEREIEQVAAHLADYLVIDTIYFGGGSPSLLAPEEIMSLLLAVEQNLSAGPEEVTLEVNLAAEPDRVRGWLQTGVTRLSFGAQSFDPVVLEILGRHYRPEQIVRLAEEAGHGSARNINLDLMIGVPGESRKTLEANLQALCQIQADHVSVYLLEELEKVTFRKVWEENPLSDEEVAETYDHYRLKLEEMGWSQYEISNFSRPGFECRHNLKYWRYEPFLGLGPSASSHLGSFRWTNPATLGEWEAAINSGQLELPEFIELTPEAELRESLAFGLRLKEGLSWEDWRRKFPALDFSHLETKLSGLAAAGLLNFQDGWICVPPKNFLVSNYILSELLW